MTTVAAVRIRPMEVADLSGVLALEQVAYPEPWSEAVFRDELSAPHRTYLVAEADGRLAGYGGLMVVGDEAHVTSVTVWPERRAGGIGTRLMLGLVDAALAAAARSLTLEVRTSNAAAQALYARFGMAPVGVRKRYYGTEDALIMWVHELDGDEYAARLASIRETAP
ncbi:MAG: ribosomal protein S18-alanine N-acetyltransferase [Acidimicrobiia bacterium]